MIMLSDRPSPTDKGMSSAVRSVIPVTIATQVLAFGAVIASSYYFGATDSTDAYYLAFSVPLVATAIGRATIQLGAIPVLSDADDPRAGRDKLGQAVTELVSVAVAMSLIIAAAATGLALLLLPVLDSSMSPEAAGLAREMVFDLAPLAPLAVLSGTLGAALNVRGHYALPVAVLMLDPVARLACMVVASRSLGVQTLVLGNVLAAFVSPLVLLWALRREKIHVKIAVPRVSPIVKKVLSLAGPLVIASTVLVINPVVDRALVTTLGAGAVTQLELGLRIYSVPIILFVSGLTAPMTAIWRRQIRDGESAEFYDTFFKVLRGIVVGALPLAIVVFVLREEIVIALLEGGAYGSADVQGTAAVLGALVLGLPAEMIIALVTVAFIATERVRIPVAFAVANVALNALLGIVLREPFGISGVALATTITVSVLMCVGVTVFRRTIESIPLRPLGVVGAWTGTVCVFMYGGVTAVHMLTPAAGDKLDAVGTIVFGAVVASLIYGVAVAVSVPKRVVRSALSTARSALR